MDKSVPDNKVRAPNETVVNSKTPYNGSRDSFTIESTIENPYKESRDIKEWVFLPSPQPDKKSAGGITRKLKCYSTPYSDCKESAGGIPKEPTFSAILKPDYKESRDIAKQTINVSSPQPEEKLDYLYTWKTSSVSDANEGILPLRELSEPTGRGSFNVNPPKIFRDIPSESEASSFSKPFKDSEQYSNRENVSKNNSSDNCGGNTQNNCVRNCVLEITPKGSAAKNSAEETSEDHSANDSTERTSRHNSHKICVESNPKHGVTKNYVESITKDSAAKSCSENTSMNISNKNCIGDVHQNNLVKTHFKDASKFNSTKICVKSSPEDTSTQHCLQDAPDDSYYKNNFDSIPEVNSATRYIEKISIKNRAENTSEDNSTKNCVENTLKVGTTNNYTENNPKDISTESCADVTSKDIAIGICAGVTHEGILAESCVGMKTSRDSFPQIHSSSTVKGGSENCAESTPNSISAKVSVEVEIKDGFAEKCSKQVVTSLSKNSAKSNEKDSFSQNIVENITKNNSTNCAVSAPKENDKTCVKGSKNKTKRYAKKAKNRPTETNNMAKSTSQANGNSVPRYGSNNNCRESAPQSSFARDLLTEGTRQTLKRLILPFTSRLQFLRQGIFASSGVTDSSSLSPGIGTEEETASCDFDLHPAIYDVIYLSTLPARVLCEVMFRVARLGLFHPVRSILQLIRSLNPVLERK